MKMLFQKWFVALSAAVIVAGCGAVPQGTNISVSDVGNVEGTVTDTSTGTPLSGVTVQIGDKSDVTGDNGVYSIQDIDVGTRTITASKTGYQNHNGTCEVSKGTTVSHSIQLTANLISDTSPPTVSSSSPANNATDIAINGAITVTFSEAMDVSTITTSTFTLEQGTTPVSGTVTYNGTTATFTPSSNLSYSTSYTATITTGAKDTAGNAMASNYSWSFTTGTAPDTTPPTVSSTSPANNATGVAINSTVTTTFSETMDSSTVTTASFTLKQGTTSISGTITYSGTTATFTPSSDLSDSTTYTATITTGVKDTAGNAMATSYLWTFTTADPGANFKMPDTGDTKGSTITFGEDHDYTINPPSYTDNGNGTITDNVTGLVWQKQDDRTPRTWDNAVTYCRNLTLAGQTGWRLPTHIELISIVYFDDCNPTINGTYFPYSTSENYWSSTTYAYRGSVAWFVDFGDGYTRGNDKAELYYVRCIRDGQ